MWFVFFGQQSDGLFAECRHRVTPTVYQTQSTKQSCHLRLKPKFFSFLSIMLALPNDVFGNGTVGIPAPAKPIRRVTFATQVDLLYFITTGLVNQADQVEVYYLY